MLLISLTKETRKLYQPKKADFIKWIKLALAKKFKTVNISIIIVSNDRSQELNKFYRNKDYATNVISLEYSDTRDSYAILTGELILCDDVICKEAIEYKKSIYEHYAHMVIHGILHLQGFDHVLEGEAKVMEKLEIELLHKLGFNNPYLISESK